MGIFAHPDDETFCIGGTLAKYIAAGAEAMVVSFTRGEAGQIRDASVATRRTLGERRASELEQACHTLGVQHVRCLDWGDGKLKDIPQQELVATAVALIREFRPHVVFTFDETGAYGHPDHITISKVTTTACRLAGDATQFPEQLQAGTPHSIRGSITVIFPQNRRLLLHLLVGWLHTSTRSSGSAKISSTHSNCLRTSQACLATPATIWISNGIPASILSNRANRQSASIWSRGRSTFVEDSAGNTASRQRWPALLGDTGLADGKPRMRTS
ncbi:MAG: PIG-L family deacetylase [Anaerolineales bacterium]|nr:PIG-L family deacetylase [Anaerolineales bacterium]